MLSLGYALLVRTAEDQDQLDRLEEWVTLTPEQMKAREQARRLAAARALGAHVAVAP